MSKEFVADISEEMWEAASSRVQKNTVLTEYGKLVRDPLAHALLGMLAHPDFQRQVRAYAAEVARGLVAEYAKSRDSESYMDGLYDGLARCRAETLAAIERWEREHG